MSATLRVVHVISKRHDVLAVAIVILYGNLNLRVFDLLLNIKHIGAERLLASIKVLNVRSDPAVEVKLVAEGMSFVVSIVDQLGSDTLSQIGLVT